MADFQFAPAGAAVVNDAVVTNDGAYFTDSITPVLYKVPIAANGALGQPQTIAVTGPASMPTAFPALNGIDATPDGDTLVVSHSTLGALLTVDPRSGASRTIELTGGGLLPGTMDGIVLDGKSVWVVENFANQVAEVRLSPDLSSEQIVRLT